MDRMEEEEVPQYFICPISLHIMKDPVTAATGITYDRESIEHWLKTAVDPVCPVTKQRLPPNSDLTPNHTLRRLIQAWCVANSKDSIPTPKTPLNRIHVIKLLRGLTMHPATLDQLLALSVSDHKELLAECGVPKAMVSLIIRCFKEKKTMGPHLDRALKILTAIWTPSPEIKAHIEENFDSLIDSLTWVIGKTADKTVQSLGILLTKEVVTVADSTLLERLEPKFFKAVVKILTYKTSTSADAKAALRVLLEVSHHGRNKYRMIEANAAHEVIQLEWAQVGPLNPEKRKITELALHLLAQLCSCAEGRAQLLAHAGGIAILSKRILRCSAVVDDRVVHILGLLSKYSATKEGLQEMLRVGAVSKLCMVLQADSAKYLKDKVREILKMHNHVWSNSPCIQVYLLTRYPMLQF